MIHSFFSHVVSKGRIVLRLTILFFKSSFLQRLFTPSLNFYHCTHSITASQMMSYKIYWKDVLIRPSKFTIDNAESMLDSFLYISNDVVQASRCAYKLQKLLIDCTTLQIEGKIANKTFSMGGMTSLHCCKCNRRDTLPILYWLQFSLAVRIWLWLISQLASDCGSSHSSHLTVAPLAARIWLWLLSQLTPCQIKSLAASRSENHTCFPTWETGP